METACVAGISLIDLAKYALQRVVHCDATNISLVTFWLQLDEFNSLGSTVPKQTAFL